MKRLPFVCLFLFTACSFVQPPVSLGDRYKKASAELQTMVKNEGVPQAMERLRQITATDSELAGQCHGLVHQIGHTAYDAYGLVQALSFNDDICGSGYTHGVIEHHFETTTDVLSQVRTICPADNATCFHGLGHGLMFATENNMPQSLQFCNGFDESFQRIQCAEGVFMENFGTDMETHPSIYLNPDDPFQTCRDQEEPYHGVCSFYVPRYYIRLHPRAYAENLVWCQDLPYESAQACVKGVGSVSMKENIDNPSFAESICRGAQAEVSRNVCVQGMVSYYMVHYASAAKGDELCASLPADIRAGCAYTVKQSRRFFSE